jgi:hypothetical protein
VSELRALGAPKVLIRAAQNGLIVRAECAMRKCYCPGGRTRFYYLSRPLGPWMPTADHIRRKMDGGTWALKNIRLAHRLCNFVDYAKEAHISFERYLAKACSEWWAGSPVPPPSSKRGGASKAMTP